jgi:hypothetical protein
VALNRFYLFAGECLFAIVAVLPTIGGRSQPSRTDTNAAIHLDGRNPHYFTLVVN